MKKEVSITAEIVKIIIDCVMIPLFFVKLFVSHAVVPGINEDGERYFSRYNHYHSIFSKFDREGMAFLVWGAIAIIILSITLSVLSLQLEDKKALKIASHIVFGISIALFFALLFFAWTIRYMY